MEASLDAGAQECRQGLLVAGRRLVQELVAAHRLCLARHQAGAFGDPAGLDAPHATLRCRGEHRVSKDRRRLPDDEATAQVVSAALAGFEGAVALACDDADVAALSLCADDVAGLQRCLFRDHQEHAHHLLDQELAAEPSVTELPGQLCQYAAGRAGALFVRARQRAVARCVRDHDGVAPADLDALCLGSVRDGQPVPPLDPLAAERFAASEARLRERVAWACPDALVEQLDLCGGDTEALADCLACFHGREAVLLSQAELGGTPAEPSAEARAFLDWEAVRNPVLEEEDRMLKDQSVVYDDGWFFVFTSSRFEPDDPDRDTKSQWFYRTRDWQTFERLSDPDLIGVGKGVGSPEVVSQGGQWLMTSQGPNPLSPDDRQIYLATSPDLVDWTPRSHMAVDLAPESSMIDGALAFAGGHFHLGYKDRLDQRFYVGRSSGDRIDDPWEGPLRSFAVDDDPWWGFVENEHFLRIDGRWFMVATSRDNEFRCLDVYTCTHEPFLYTLSGDGSAFAHWGQWRHKYQLVIPYEEWNTQMHANTGHLDDWREHDGFFYLTYSGATDNVRFESRGHGKIGIARSRDLIHWRLPGDLRD